MILITGARGMLGSDLAEVLGKKYGASEVRATDLPELDILNATMLREFVGQLKPSIIINTAAYTDVDRAETDRDFARALNATGPKNLAQAAKDVGALLVHFSTDHVFDGKSTTPWTETSEPNPANYYGQSKYEGDLEVQKYRDHLIVRVQWLYGKLKNRFTQLKTKQTFTPFVDQFGAPTWTLDISDATLRLIEKNQRGLFNFSYDDFGSWMDVYECVKKTLGCDTQLIPKYSHEVSLPAKRPHYAVMSNAKYKEAVGLAQVGTWRERLIEFLAHS